MAKDLVSSNWSKTNRAASQFKRATLVTLFLSLALFVSLLLEPSIPHAYVALMTAACAVSGWMEGKYYGVAAGFLAGLSIAYFFLSPVGGFHVPPDALPSAGLFLAGAIGAGWLSGAWRKNRDHLKESTDQFRLLLDGIKDHAVFLLDSEGNVATWNTGAQRITGFAAGEILGKSHSIFYSAEDARTSRQKGWNTLLGRCGDYHAV